jgi:hypothetical protein
MVAEKVNNGKEKLIDIPENYYKDLKYLIDIVITGEQLDMRADAANRLMILQALSAVPDLLTNPNKRKLIAPVLESVGINPADLDTQEAPQLTETISKMAGGGISKMPNMPSPVAGQREVRI